MDEFMDLMDTYADKFGSIFPTMCFQTDSTEQLMEKMQRCIDENTPAKKLFGLDYRNDY